MPVHNSNPELKQQILDLVALGLPDSRIALSLKITVNSVIGMRSRAKVACNLSRGPKVQRSLLVQSIHKTTTISRLPRNDGKKYPPMPEPECLKMPKQGSITVFNNEVIAISDKANETITYEETHPIIHLTEYTCHWPFGDPSKWRTGEFRYCMAVKVPEQPYCEEHRRIA